MTLWLLLLVIDGALPSLIAIGSCYHGAGLNESLQLQTPTPYQALPIGYNRILLVASLTFRQEDWQVLKPFSLSQQGRQITAPPKDQLSMPQKSSRSTCSLEFPAPMTKLLVKYDIQKQFKIRYQGFDPFWRMTGTSILWTPRVNCATWTVLSRLEAKYIIIMIISDYWCVGPQRFTRKCHWLITNGSTRV